MHEGFHHLHQRKRAGTEIPERPAVRVMDKVMYVIGALGPIMTVPQVVKIWVDHSVEGVSAISWMSYFIFSVFWIAYGILHKEKTIIFTYCLWFILNGLVAIGALIYR